MLTPMAWPLVKLVDSLDEAAVAIATAVGKADVDAAADEATVIA